MNEIAKIIEELNRQDAKSAKEEEEREEKKQKMQANLNKQVNQNNN